MAAAPSPSNFANPLPTPLRRLAAVGALIVLIALIVQQGDGRARDAAAASSSAALAANPAHTIDRLGEPAPPPRHAPDSFQLNSQRIVWRAQERERLMHLGDAGLLYLAQRSASSDDACTADDARRLKILTLAALQMRRSDAVLIARGHALAAALLAAPGLPQRLATDLRAAR